MKAREAFRRYYNEKPHFMTNYTVAFGSVITDKGLLHWELSNGRGIFCRTMWAISLLLEDDNGILSSPHDYDRDIGGIVTAMNDMYEASAMALAKETVLRWVEELNMRVNNPLEDEQ